MQMLKVNDLIPHPQNGEFFDDMSGGKWKEFLESVKTSGVIEPIVVTEKNVIVSGHQRVRACKELGIPEIMCEVRQYNGDEGRVLKDLIETNVRQRGTIGGTDEQIRKRVDVLKGYYGVKNGRPKTTFNESSFDEDAAHNLKEVCERAGTSVGIYQRAQMLAKAVPEVKEIIEQGRMSVSTARSFIAKLSDDEQRELLAKLPAAGKLTQAEVQKYVDQLRDKDDEIAQREDEIAALTAEKEEAERAAREALEAVNIRT